jgi:hypothetical protein
MVATLNAKLDQWLHALPFEARSPTPTPTLTWPEP